MANRPFVSPTEFARRLRQDQTDAERSLWQRLRNGALGVKFRRQHPLASYVLDFCCLSHRLVVELDGDQHAEAEAVLRDEKRDQTLRQLGFRVVRFGNRQVLTEPTVVLDAIRALLDDLQFDASNSSHVEESAPRGSTTPDP